MLSKLFQLTMAATLLAGLCAAEQKTVSGTLMDKACSAETIKKGAQAIKEHDIGCATMDDCAKSGYGVVTSDGQFLAFDAAGNKRAAAALKTATKKTDLQVSVTGDVSGDQIKVTTLKLL